MGHPRPTSPPRPTTDEDVAAVQRLHIPVGRRACVTRDRTAPTRVRACWPPPRFGCAATSGGWHARNESRAPTTTPGRKRMVTGRTPGRHHRGRDATHGSKPGASLVRSHLERETRWSIRRVTAVVSRGRASVPVPPQRRKRRRPGSRVQKSGLMVFAVIAQNSRSRRATVDGRSRRPARSIGGSRHLPAGGVTWICGNSKSSGPSHRRVPSPALESSCICRNPR